MSAMKLVSPLCWPGGKRRLVKRILSRIPPHRVYVEPFVGAGHVFWAKEPSKVEVINDLDPGLMKWYKDLKKRSRFACDMTPNKEKFYRIKAKPRPLSFCDYFHLIKLSYGCKGTRHDSGKERQCLKREDPSMCNVSKFTGKFGEYGKRLRDTIILNGDYRKVLKKFDGPDTFAYLDPPFHELSCPYVSCDVNPRQIAGALRRLKGKWLLSYNDHPDVRAAFKGYRIEKVQTRYEMQRKVTGTSKPVVELLISN